MSYDSMLLSIPARAFTATIHIKWRIRNFHSLHSAAISLIISESVTTPIGFHSSSTIQILCTLALMAFAITSRTLSYCEQQLKTWHQKGNWKGMQIESGTYESNMRQTIGSAGLSRTPFASFIFWMNSRTGRSTPSKFLCVSPRKSEDEKLCTILWFSFTTAIPFTLFIYLSLVRARIISTMFPCSLTSYTNVCVCVCVRERERERKK